MIIDVRPRNGVDDQNRDTSSMKHGCLTSLAVLVALYAIISIWVGHASRPSALYERWFGEPVPSDISDLDGLSQFALTESTNWLYFRTSQQRIDLIVSHLSMAKVSPTHGWHGPGATQDLVVAGKIYHTSWFDPGFYRLHGHLNEIQVYWKAHRPEDILAGGYALYFIPSTGQAFYTSISI
jgi:hypothetical protein